MRSRSCKIFYLSKEKLKNVWKNEHSLFISVWIYLIISGINRRFFSDILFYFFLIFWFFNVDLCKSWVMNSHEVQVLYSKNWNNWTISWKLINISCIILHVDRQMNSYLLVDLVVFLHQRCSFLTCNLHSFSFIKLNLFICSWLKTNKTIIYWSFFVFVPSCLKIWYTGINSQFQCIYLLKAAFLIIWHKLI